MTPLRTRLAVITAAIAFSSCAPPAQEVVTPAPEASKASAKKPAPAPQPTTQRRPVLMNGRGKVSSISLTDCFTRQQNGEILLYDARPQFFYLLGHIPGAINLPKNNFEAEMPKHEAEIKAALAEGKTIVVYCTNMLCPDARSVANRLAGYGYSSSTLTGGWDSWKNAGLPTE